MMFAFLGRLSSIANHTQPDRHYNIDSNEVNNEVTMYTVDYNVARESILGYLGKVENRYLCFRKNWVKQKTTS